GVFFNLSSWLVRWVAGYEREIAMLRQGGSTETPWVFRYIPFANLYDLSLAFAFGAGIATLILARKKNFQVLSAFTLPLAAIILTLARFIGDEFIDLPPVLDSYWRPIHVGVASLSYGIALVCFAVAVIYLLKDKAKVEAMAIWSSLFGVAVIATISKFSVFTELVYRAGLFIPNPNGGKPFPSPFRLDLPYAGPALAVAGILLLGVVVAYAIYVLKDSEPARKAGGILVKLAFVAQIVSLIFVITGMKADRSVQAELRAQLAADPTQWVVAGKAIAEKQDLSATEFAALQPSQLERMAQDNLQRFGGQMFTDLNTNPVEVSGLITALAGTFFILLFGFKTEKLRERLPSLDSL